MAEAAAKEPSMEDILSSIRKIIADEGGPSRDDGPATNESPARAPVQTAQERSAQPPAAQQQTPPAPPATPAPSSQAAPTPPQSLAARSVPEGSQSASAPSANRMPEPSARPATPSTAMPSETGSGLQQAAQPAMDNRPVQSSASPAPEQHRPAPSAMNNEQRPASPSGSLASIAESVKARSGNETPAEPRSPSSGSAMGTSASQAETIGLSRTALEARPEPSPERSVSLNAGSETADAPMQKDPVHRIELSESVPENNPVKPQASAGATQASSPAGGEAEIIKPSEASESAASTEPSGEAVSVFAGASTKQADEEAKAFKGALMSPSADNAVSTAFDRLKRSTMDDMDAKTEAILRPMLREWLDENLPKLVEKLVREEIERVARGSQS